MAILTLKVVNLTYYNLKGGQFKVILTLKVAIFDLKVIKNGFGISDLISDFGISDFKIISDFGFGISDLPKYFSFYAILILQLGHTAYLFECLPNSNIFLIM